MKQALSAALLLLCSYSTFLWALPPQDEMRRLVLATQQAVQAQRWDDAARYLNHIEALKVDKKPAEYLFLRGEVMYHAGQLNEAKDALDAYVVAAGEKGDHYTKSLEMITAIDEAQRTDSATPAQKPVATIKPAGEEENLSQLEKLYLTSSPRDALIAHLNSILATHAWTGDQRIRKPNARQGIRYHISAGGSGRLLIQKTRYDEQGQAAVSLSTMQVYGVSPLVREDCLSTLPECWVYDPRDDSPLFRMAGDADAAGQAAQTLGELIRQMQHP